MSDNPLTLFLQFISLGAVLLRQYSYQNAKIRSQRFVKYTREKLAKLTTGQEQLQYLCRYIQEEWDASRVSIVSVKNGHSLILASEGPDAIPVDLNTRPQKPGPFLRRVCKEKHILYAPVAEEFGTDLHGYGLRFSSIAVPISVHDHVQAVLFIMASDGTQIMPRDATIIEESAGSLSLEISFAINRKIAEEQVKQLREVTAATSGIVLEQLDDWGRLPDITSESRRIIISADGMRTTQTAMASGNSNMIWSVYTSYKIELYATWFGLRSAFEFISKDVRGDDFWALSPKEFRNPTLRVLGPERAALILSYLIDKHARMISYKDEYRCLSLQGAHVATGAAKIKMLSLGIAGSKCLDIDSPQMSRIHRIRAEAQPSKVLVDISDDALERAVLDQSLFSSTPFSTENLTSKSFSGIYSLPKIQTLEMLTADLKELRKLENIAIQMAHETIYQKKSA